MRLTLRWERREPPLTAAAVTAHGPAAAELRTATSDYVLRGRDLRATGTAERLIVLGQAGDLPWVDQAIYLGWDGGLLVPTTLSPWPSAELVRQSLAVDYGLVTLLPDGVLVSRMPRRRADPAVLSGRDG